MAGSPPEAINIRREVDRLRGKLDAGTDYIMIQPTFRPEGLEVVGPFREQVPVLVVVLILRSLVHAHRIAQNPEVVVPYSIYDCLGVFSAAADQALAGRDLAVQQDLQVKEQGWARAVPDVSSLLSDSHQRAPSSKYNRERS